MRVFYWSDVTIYDNLILIIRRESETTEYDCSTDDESLRFLMSETDQVHHADDDHDYDNGDNDDDSDDDDDDDYDDNDDDDDDDDDDGDDCDDIYDGNDLTLIHTVSRLLRPLQQAKQLWQPAQLARQVQIFTFLEIQILGYWD